MVSRGGGKEGRREGRRREGGGKGKMGGTAELGAPVRRGSWDLGTPAPSELGAGARRGTAPRQQSGGQPGLPAKELPGVCFTSIQTRDCNMICFLFLRNSQGSLNSTQTRDCNTLCFLCVII